MNIDEKIITNPITDLAISHFKKTENKLFIAVPYVSAFSKKILDHRYTKYIADKKLIINFNESNINTFEIPTLMYLLNSGFVICYNNDIHLKLYITDTKSLITSSNLTKGGFESNFELTVNVDSSNLIACNKIFNDLWEISKNNLLTEKMLEENIEIYEFLKRKQKFKKNKTITVNLVTKISELNIQKLIDYIFNDKDSYLDIIELSYEANKKRSEFKNDLLINKFEEIIFYADEEHFKRRENLFYNFVYGIESKLAGTGLREAQFKDVFTHPEFHKAITFIYPEIIGLTPWNFGDEESYINFCNGLFDFNIPQYSETLPIRLASYFYPENFLPIFKLDHLQKVCVPLGINTNAETKGERLFAYNSFLKGLMNNIPHNNYVKAHMAYQLLYSIELYNKLRSGENFENIINGYKRHWIKYYIRKGLDILKSIDALQI